MDTRNGIVSGRVSRIDPAVEGGTVRVDVMLEGALPKGARPDLTVDGTIELERLADVLFVGRPAAGQEQGSISLFRIEPDGKHASRVDCSSSAAPRSMRWKFSADFMKAIVWCFPICPHGMPSTRFD